MAKKWYNVDKFVPFVPFHGTMHDKISEKENSHVQDP